MSKLRSFVEGKLRPRKWCHTCGKWVRYITKLSGDVCPHCKTVVTKGP